MFESSVYKNRRTNLLAQMVQKDAHGIAIFLGNAEAPQNYRGNDYKFRQDSSFLYFWGIDDPFFAAILDLDTSQETIYGNDVDIDDIIWMGPQPTVASKAALVGVENTESYANFMIAVKEAQQKGRDIHFLPPARYYNTMTLSNLLGSTPEAVRKVALTTGEGAAHASEELVRSAVALRIIKEASEIEEMDKAADLGIKMHTAARNAIRPGIVEQEVVGKMEGVTLEEGWGVSFASIVSQNGETLHNHTHHQIITPGRLLVVDAGAETNAHYASDFTRNYPCSGKFTSKQRDIYNIVVECNELGYQLAKPGVTYRDVHLSVSRHMLEGLKSLDLVRGNVDDMVENGIAGLFQPHGLGHNMGMDVHDMEDYGENFVGYDDDQKRGSYLGLANLRMARRLRPGHVITDEPGIYFIPALAADFKKSGADKGFVNFEKFEQYNDFGGIRLEDDILITEDGSRRLGSSRLPITADDVEAAMEANK
jgi:Xaa-Pro aminopeptidase